MIYEPAEDSFLLAEEVKRYCKGKKFLDMGAGSGIQSQTAMKNKAKSALGVDINEESSLIFEKMRIPFILSDLFSNVKGKFDLIVFNPPYFPLKSSQASPIPGRDAARREVYGTLQNFCAVGQAALSNSAQAGLYAILPTLRAAEFKGYFTHDFSVLRTKDVQAQPMQQARQSMFHVVRGTMPGTIEPPLITHQDGAFSPEVAELLGSLIQ